MITPILSTKFNIPPPRSDSVRRDRLLNRLDEGRNSKLILISAPAGFGKTTIMSTWIETSALPTVWLSLDPEDNDINRFLAHSINALGGISPQASQASLSMLNSTQSPALDSILTLLINELSSIQTDFFFFLDDYHLIENQQIHAFLENLIEHIPLKMHLVVSSRSDPPLPISRLRVRGQLTEVRQNDLRFSPDEAADFLKRTFHLNLTAEQIAVLDTRTEGWIAGLQLAALSMRGREDINTFIQAFSGSHRFVIDYLADEVYSQQPEDLRVFLCQTSILDRFTAPLCDVITGRKDSVAVLRKLEDANLFITPLDEQRIWFRYHHLFSDFLRARLDEQTKAYLNKVACQWFIEEGLYSEAVKYALMTRDDDITVSAIAGAVPDAFNKGAFQSVLGWMDALAEDTVLNNPILATYKGFVLFLTGPHQEALPYADAAEKHISPDTPEPLYGKFLSLKAHVALCEGRSDECIRYSYDALENLSEQDIFIRHLTLNILGQLLEMRSDVASAVDIYRQAYESGWRSGDYVGSLVVFTNLVFSLNELGRRLEAVTLCEQAIADRKTHSKKGAPFLDAIYLPWSLLLYEANKLNLAMEYAQRAIDLLTAVNFPLGILWAEYILALIHKANGDLAPARDLILRGGQLTTQLGREQVQGQWFTALEAQIELEGGNLSRAVQWAEKLKYTPQDIPHLWSEYPYFTYIRILLAQNKNEDAQMVLEKMESQAAEQGRFRKLITIHLLQAITLDKINNTSQAVNQLERALELAVPERYYRAFLDEGEAIAQLLPAARQTAPSFVDELLLNFRTPHHPTREVEWLIDPLTEREQEILRLVARGMSNREIAEALFVTLGTIKKHLNNIFSKLSVKSRTQAITRGRELGLLE